MDLSIKLQRVLERQNISFLKGFKISHLCPVIISTMQWNIISLDPDPDLQTETFRTFEFQTKNL